MVPTDQQQANAHLMAAAPDMLDLLFSLRINLADMLEWASIDAGTDTAIHNQLAAIESGIAKAQGGG